MNYEDSFSTQDLLDLIQIIDAWEIPEEDYAEVINQQARLAGLDLEAYSDPPHHSPYASLRF